MHTCTAPASLASAAVAVFASQSALLAALAVLGRPIYEYPCSLLEQLHDPLSSAGRTFPAFFLLQAAGTGPSSTGTAARPTLC